MSQQFNVFRWYFWERNTFAHQDTKKTISRERWMLEFCDVMLEFYPKEIAKIGEQVSRFEAVREYWLRAW